MNQQATRLEQDKKNIFITFKILILLFCATPIAQALIATNGDGELVSMNFVKALVFFSIVAFVMLFLCSCSDKVELREKNIYAMDTVITINLFAMKTFSLLSSFAGKRYALYPTIKTEETA